MPYGLKRADLRAMAQSKIDDATVLFQNGRFSNAYYLAGYAIEIALKACIAAQVSAETIPGKAFLRGVLNHQFPLLVGLAGLAGPLKEKQDKDARFASYWAIVNEWSPDCRYETKDSMSAQLMVQSVSHPDSGVCNGSRHTGDQWSCFGKGIGFGRIGTTAGNVGAQLRR